MAGFELGLKEATEPNGGSIKKSRGPRYWPGKVRLFFGGRWPWKRTLRARPEPRAHSPISAQLPGRGGRPVLRVRPPRRTKAVQTTDRRATRKPYEIVRSRTRSRTEPYEPQRTAAKYAKYASAHPNSAPSIKPSYGAAATRIGANTWRGCTGPFIHAPPMAAPPSPVSSPA